MGSYRVDVWMRNLEALSGPVTLVKGVGSGMLRHLHALDIHTVEDLIFHFPRRYLDRSRLVPIRDVRIGEEVTVVGTVREVEESTTNRGLDLLQISIYDGTSYLYGVWFNQPYHRDRLLPGTVVAFSGKVQNRFGRLQMVNPAYDIVEDVDEVGRRTVHTGRIIPLHPASQKLSSAMLRRLIARALEQFGDLPDFLPLRLRVRYGMPHRRAALREIHFPTSSSRLKTARERLAYEELFLIQVALAVRRFRLGDEEEGIAHSLPGELVSSFIRGLPFSLTPAQVKAFREIASDMAKPHPMNRLLQGEVGSGKTVVALLALLLTVENGHQGAFMAPTEILAEQHFRNLLRLLEGFPGVRLELLTGSTPSGRRKEILEAVEGGMVDILVGTHALIQEDVRFRDLGLVVVDEQHRFGVRQRMLLKAKGMRPDTLIMTATPIPRTLSLTLYGDLEVSVIDQLPRGRAGTTTHVIGPRDREGAYRVMKEEMRKGRQGYVVCPLVDESKAMEVKAAEKEVKELRKAFPGFEVGMIHGQMPRQEREQVMERFRQGEIKLLVSTTVIEVGIDVPNATFMLVEDADRFGLSQLHQLRGRVGRGVFPSHCFFIFRGDTEESLQRRKAISEIGDGFRLAEADLEIRGEGSLFGPRQSGFTDLKVARLTRDLPLLEKAREDALALVRRDPGLEADENLLLRTEVERRFKDSLEWIFHA